MGFMTKVPTGYAARRPEYTGVYYDVRTKMYVSEDGSVASTEAARCQALALKLPEPKTPHGTCSSCGAGQEIERRDCSYCRVPY